MKRKLANKQCYECATKTFLKTLIKKDKDLKNEPISELEYIQWTLCRKYFNGICQKEK